VRPVQKSLAKIGIHDRTYLFEGSFLLLYFVLDLVDFVFGLDLVDCVFIFRGTALF